MAILEDEAKLIAIRIHKKTVLWSEYMADREGKRGKRKIGIKILRRKVVRNYDEFNGQTSNH
jgi:hypothetical protein